MWYGENLFCPMDPGTGNRSVVGCSPLASAQILNYHRYIGNRVWTTENDSYISTWTDPDINIDLDAETLEFPKFEDYNEPWELESLNTYLDDLRFRYTTPYQPTSDQRAALCFVAGVAGEASYSSSASGAQIYDSYYIDKFEYDYAEWIPNIPSLIIPKLKIDMKNAQPAYVTVSNESGGHAIVCDGLMINDEYEEFFHMNYGWSGSYNNWYNLPELNVFNHILDNCVVHISPPGSNGFVTGNISLNGGNGNIEDVVVTVGYREVHPDANGDYEIEIYNGNYSVSAFLNGYSETLYFDEIEVVTGQYTSNINLTLNEYIPNILFVPISYSSIQSAIDAAEDGDIVIVSPSTYYENINFNGKKIIVASCYYLGHNEDYISNTIISGLNVVEESKVVTFNHGEDHNSVLKGFTIKDGLTTDNLTGAGIICYASSPILSNLIVTNNTSDSGSAISLKYSNATIENVIVYDNYVDHGGVIYADESQFSINNSIIHNNLHTAVKLDDSDCTIKNTTIVDNTLKGVYTFGNNLTMQNCFLWGNNNGNSQVVGFGCDTFDINYSDIQGGLPQGATGTGNIDEEPLVDANYKPLWTATEYSPLIDTGDPSIFDPDGTRSDMGAVRAIDHKNETIELIGRTEGINWLCFPVINTTSLDADLAENWLSDIWDNTILDRVTWIEDGDIQFIDYIGEVWTNPLHEFTSVQGYKMYMHESFDLDVTGFLEPSLTTIELSAGSQPEGRVNWVGYFPEVSMNPLDAFEAVLDKINKIQTRDFTLVKTEFGWIGTGWTLNYGDLVVVNCTEDCSFYWGEQGGGSVPKKERSSSEGFSFDEEADYIPVFVELDPEALDNPTEIGIFVDNECKGAEVIEDSLVQICAYVLNDSMAFDPGSVEFELYYGSRSENMLIDTYFIKENINEAGNIEKLDFSRTQNSYYLISLKESDNNVPGVIKTSLAQNYPNPFNPVTTINYSLAVEGNIELIVYNIKGQKVKTLVNEKKELGHYQAIWDGTDNNKKQVSSGVYFYRLSTGEKTMNKKMLLLK
jgi:hypothetical protein